MSTIKVNNLEPVNGTTISLTGTLSCSADVTASSMLVEGDAFIQGDLDVQGAINAVIYNETELHVEDKIIQLASGSSGSAADGGGIKLGGSDTLDSEFSLLYTQDTANPRLILSGTNLPSLHLSGGLRSQGLARFDSSVTASQSMEVTGVLKITPPGSADQLALTVSGNTNFAGDVTASQGLYVTNVYGNTTFAGQVTASNGATITGDLSCSQDVYVANDLTIGGTLIGASPVAVSGTMTVSGSDCIATVGSGSVEVSGSGGYCSIGTGSFALSGSETFEVWGPAHIYNDLNIGTQNQSDQLTVYSQFTASNSMEVTGVLKITPPGSADQLALTVSGNTNFAGDVTASQGLELNNEHPKLLFQATHANGDGQIVFKAADGSQLANIRCDTTSNTLNQFSINAGAGEDHLIVDANGYVGIGTTSPTDALHVDGTIYASNEITASAGLNVSGNADFAGDLTASQGLYVTGALATFACDITASNASKFIGEISASSGLHVSGHVTASHGLRVVSGDRTHINGDFTASQGLFIGPSDHGGTGHGFSTLGLYVGNGVTTMLLGDLTASNGALIKDDKKLYFGDDGDATIEYDENGTNELRFAGAAVTFEQDVTFDNDVTLGVAASDITTVTGKLTASNGATITGDLSCSQDVYVTGDLTVDGTLQGASPLAIGGDVAFTSGDLEVTGTIKCTGDLEIQGAINTTVHHETELHIADKIIQIASGASDSAADAGGLKIGANAASFLWDNGNQQMHLDVGLAVSGTTTIIGDITCSQGISANDQNITNVGNIALDTISSDGAAITVNSDLTCSQGIRVNMLTASDGATLDGLINVYGDLTCSQGIRVNNGPSILDGVINIYGDLSASQGLTVNEGTTTLGGDVTASQGIKINAGGLAVNDGTTTFSGDVTASQGFKVSSGLLQAGGGATLDGVTTLYGDITASQGLKVSDGTTTFAGDVTASQGLNCYDQNIGGVGQITIETLSANGSDITCTSDLTCSQGIRVNMLTASDGATLDGIINLYGDVTASQGIRVNNGATLDGVINLYGDVTASQGIKVNGGATLDGVINVYGDVTASQGIKVNGGAILDGVISVYGDLTASQGLKINEGGLTVNDGTTTFNGDLTASQGLKVNEGGITVSAGNTTCQGLTASNGFIVTDNGDFRSNVDSVFYGDLTASQAFKVGSGGAEFNRNEASTYVATLFAEGDNANRYGMKIQAGADDGSGTTYYVNCFDGDGGNVGYLANIGGTFAATDPSDKRLKDNIRDTEVAGLETVQAIKVRDFEMKKNGISKTGFVAQELQKAYAPAVTVAPDNPEGMMGVTYSTLVPVLIKAVQELKAENKASMAEIAKLKKAVAALKKK